MSTDIGHVTSRVRSQYELYPYPLRHPEDEHHRLIFTMLDDLAPLNYYCYGGRRDFRRGFRALVAGGGTGDAVVFLAHQLRGTDAQIVYVDLSTSSMEIAQKRIEVRGLQHMVSWIHGSLLDLPSMHLEPFDYINCTGVLHHLADPAAGLAALRSVLKDDGAIGIVLYGLYGRTGVYQVQQLMRLINAGEPDPARKLEQTKRMLRSLPATNWFSRARNLFPHDFDANDSECYDMFLHDQDRAYSVPQLYQFLEHAGLHLREFTYEQRALYDPFLQIQDPALKQTISELPRCTQQAIAEISCGMISTHACWATAKEHVAPDDFDPENVPFFTRLAIQYNVREAILREPSSAWQLQIMLSNDTGVTLTLERTPEVLRFIDMIDGQRTMGAIAADLMCHGMDQRTAWNICLRTLRILKSADLLLLSHRLAPLPNGAG